MDFLYIYIYVLFQGGNGGQKNMNYYQKSGIIIKQKKKVFESTELIFKGGDTSRIFKKSKIFFLLKSIEKLFKNIIPKFYW